MKLKTNLIIMCMALGLVGCSAWTEPEEQQLSATAFHTLTPEQEQALIAYKNSDHKLFFACSITRLLRHRCSHV